MSSLGKRVRMGATLAVGAAALLWLHSRFPAGVLSLAVVTVLAVLSAWEFDRMGSFRGRKLGTMLYSTSALSCLALAFVLAKDDARELHPGTGLVGLYAFAGLLSWPWATSRW